MTTTISLSHITKIEGHATLSLRIERGRVAECELSSVEGSRYFEGLVKGRHFSEASEITSRICGICSCAHTIAAISAVENALGAKPSRQTLLLRELLMIGERIRSHATHLYFFALPDFVGCESALALLPKRRADVERALRLMKAGNAIISAVGGRDLHPVSATVGGFLKVPSQGDLESVARLLDAAVEDAVATARLFGELPLPGFSRPTQFMSLYNGRSYPLLSGGIRCSSPAGGVSARDFPPGDFHKFVSEYHEPHSTANFVVKDGKSYAVGALARANNNFRFLSREARSLAGECGFSFPSANPFANNFAQCLELVHYVGGAAGLCRELAGCRLEPLVAPRAGGACRGIAAVEVPRGVLWHEYELNSAGEIAFANIVTPTAQNLRNMQDDVAAFVPGLLKLPRGRIVLELEKLIRAYDPCFSCSTHFLKVKWLKPRGALVL